MIHIGEHAGLVVLSWIALFWLLVRYLTTYYKPGLRQIPGPLVARFSSLYRPWKIAKGDAPVFYRKLHEQYGQIVRTGPNTVSISDPNAVSTVYGISSKFLKVSLTPCSPRLEALCT